MGQNRNSHEADAVKKALRKFFRSNTGNHLLDDSDDLFSLGLMNSLMVIHLVSFVENEFGIVLSGEDLDAAHFRTVDALAKLIDSKLR